MKKTLAIILAIVAVLTMTAVAVASTTTWLTIEMEPVDGGCDMNVNVRAIHGDTELNGVEVEVLQEGDTVAVETTDYHQGRYYAEFVLRGGKTYTFSLSKEGYRDKTVEYTLPECN